MSSVDPTGITRLKEVKINITGRNGVRNVQNGFIKIEEIIRHHRLNVKDSQIIKWITDGLGPEQVKTNVSNYLLKDSKDAQKVKKSLKKYHKKLRKLAKQFADAYELGMQEKAASSRANNEGSGGGSKKKGSGGEGKKKSTSATGKQEPKGSKSKTQKEKEKQDRIKRLKIKCAKCGGSHYASDCTASEEACKKWMASDAGKALSEKLKKKRANKRNPGGGEKSTGSSYRRVVEFGRSQ